MTPEEAYQLALKYGPSDYTREIACQDPECAYNYALDIDKIPRDDTREAACEDPWCAYHYALKIDKQPRDDTRKAACREWVTSCFYAAFVDKHPTIETWQAVKGTGYEKDYIEWCMKNFKIHPEEYFSGMKVLELITNI